MSNFNFKQGVHTNFFSSSGSVLVVSQIDYSWLSSTDIELFLLSRINAIFKISRQSNLELLFNKSIVFNSTRRTAIFESGSVLTSLTLGHLFFHKSLFSSTTLVICKLRLLMFISINLVCQKLLFVLKLHRSPSLGNCLLIMESHCWHHWVCRLSIV